MQKYRLIGLLKAVLKSIIKLLYNACPSPLNIYVRDILFYIYARQNGAVNINNIDYIKRNEAVVVLGNGPSINEDRHEIESLAGVKDFVCVNNFCDDELYSVLKPVMYVFLDAYFFSDNAHETWIIRREKTFKILNEVTDWEMNIVVPASANIEIIKRKISNDKINIVKFSAQSLFSTKLTAFKSWLFDKGIYGPPQINVLIYGIYLSVLTGYKDVVFFGADLSFHNDVRVDQNNNNLYIEYKHFNEKNTIELLMKNPSKVERWKMSELMKLTADTFYAHEVINEYAIGKGVSIRNASSYSLIDAYPRFNMSEI